VGRDLRRPAEREESIYEDLVAALFAEEVVVAV
jgi:hypothetical protein